MPSVSVRCPGCLKRLAAPRGAVGRTLKCPICRAGVTVPDVTTATPVDEGAPDFSYLRNQSDSQDDILVADGPDDDESVLGQSTARQPATPTVTVPVPSAPAPLVYIPLPVTPATPTNNPFAQLGEQTDRPRQKPAEPPAEKKDPPSTRKRPRDPDPEPATDPVTRTPGWVWPVLVALLLYAAAATGVGVLGWLRPTPADPPAKSAR